jgi:hypothetical protein
MKPRIITAVAVVAVWAFVASLTLPAAETPQAGKDGWSALFNGKDLKGWHIRNPKQANNWKVKDGVLVNEKDGGTDLISDNKLMDHELHIEFCCPPNGNSGVYLQGLYEIQVGDSSKAREVSNSICGAIYGKIAPQELVKVGEITAETYEKETNWQTFDVKFRSAQLGPDGAVAKKARITVIHNGKLIIDNAEIDGVTGSAVSDKEGTYAGLMLQGDHSRMKYRNILYRMMKPEANYSPL